MKDTGNRKFLLGVLFLVYALIVTLGAFYMFLRMEPPPDLVAAATLLGAAVVSPIPGVIGVIWGNVEEHRAKNGGTP